MLIILYTDIYLNIDMGDVLMKPLLIPTCLDDWSLDLIRGEWVLVLRV